ncbi:MAG TPA: saccharopine dehydrogenase C-terminal domain-containing protein [Candidatus Limnocylindria bacterium]|nr:saccharopine dehydrogenase C-terminal domain-containing protein [Candidatus Limnocylindria bacterium]
MTTLRVLLIGAGGVGEAIARVAAGREWLEQMVVADYNSPRADQVARQARAAVAGSGHDDRFKSARVDASSAAAVTELARRHGADLVMNAVDPQFVMPIFDGALAAGTDYMDMANSLSRPHPDKPFERPGVKLGDEQFARAGEWERAGRLALLGMGMDPGLTDVFAAYAAKHLFDEVHEVHIRDGGDLEIPGFAFAPVFSIWTTIEECLNPPVVWSDGEWHTTEPFSGPEMFPFPDGVGDVECVNVEHEEVLLVPRWIPARKVTFKYALGSDFIDKLRTIHALGMDRTDKVRVKGVEVAPRDVLAAITPDPAGLGDRMVGRAIVGTWVIGRKDGAPREVFLYQTTDAQETWRRFGLGAVAWQTGFNPVIALELLASGAWSGTSVLAPEAFDPDPYLALLDKYGIHHAMVDMEPGRHRPT